MKKNYISMGALAIFAIALLGCNKFETNIEIPERGGIPFEFMATNAITKTTNSGVSTNWKSGDNVNLFHAVAGSSSYTSDGKFTAGENGSAVKFSGTLAGELTAANYDWYAIYPQNDNISTPANTGTKGYVTVGQKTGATQKQTGNNSTSHIAGTNYPVAGSAKDVAKDTKPEISMTHLTSLVEVNVTNGTDSPITVTNITFTGTEDIIGTFFINFVSSPVEYTSSGLGYTDPTASLQVVSGSPIAKDGSAKFYFAIKPFTAPKDATLTLTVTADNGEQSKDLELSTKAFTFAAGTKNTLNFSYTKTATTSEVWQLTSLADITSSDVFVIVGTNASGSYAMTNNGGTSSAPSATAVTTTIVEGKTRLSSNPGPTIMWHLTKDGSNLTFYPNETGTSTYFYCSTAAASGSNNNMRVGTGARNVFVLNASNQLETNDDKVKRYLSIYNNSDWRGYINTDLAPTITFYKRITTE